MIKRLIHTLSCVKYGRIQFAIMVFLFAYGVGIKTYAAGMGSFEEASLAMAKTQAFLQQRNNQAPPSSLLSPMESLKRDNMRQLERKAGPLFGRFYDERKLLNSPAEHTSRNSGLQDSASDKAVLPATKNSYGIKTASPASNSAGDANHTRESDAVNFLEMAEPETQETGSISAKAHDSKTQSIDQKIKSTQKESSPGMPDNTSGSGVSPKQNLTPQNNLLEFSGSPKAPALSSSPTASSRINTGAVDVRAIVTRPKLGLGLPRWVKRLQKIDEPVNEVQLFMPKP